MFVWYKKIRGVNKILHNSKNIPPPVSFYSLNLHLTDGKQISFKEFIGKKILLVNTASDCGYTNQYKELQKLYEFSKEDLEIIAFPSNNFKRQEKGTDREIKKFCTENFSVSFLLSQKTIVVKSQDQHPVYQWLTQKEKNGWNDQQPTWNFSKFLVNEEGMLTHYFDPAISPVSEEMIRAVEE